MTASTYKGIQVKTVSRELPSIPIGKSIYKLMGDWWIIVINVATHDPLYFIMKRVTTGALVGSSHPATQFI